MLMRRTSVSQNAGRARGGTFRAQRGGVYIAVLGASLLVTILGVTALAATALERLTVAGTSQMAKARAAAESGIDLGLLDIKNTPAWRTLRPNGVWFSNRPVGDATVTLEGTDPVDGDLTDDPADPLVLKATAVHGSATHITQVTLAAQVRAMDVLRTTMHAAGETHIKGGKNLTATGGPVSSNLSIEVDGTVTGDIEAPLKIGGGTVTGSSTVPSPVKLMPGMGPVTSYTNLASTTSPPSTIEETAFGPGVNPWGATNPDGVYVISTVSDVTIRNARVYGTLVIRAPGKKVTLEGNLLMHPARADYPTLIVEGDLVIKCAGGGAVLDEDPLDVSLNPPGAPYEGSTDLDDTDKFPSELRGLIHVTGTVFVDSNATVRGTVIAESTAPNDAIEINNDPTVIHEPALWTNPPEGYRFTGGMAIVPGSWVQVTLP